MTRAVPAGRLVTATDVRATAPTGDLGWVPGGEFLLGSDRPQPVGISTSHLGFRLVVRDALG